MASENLPPFKILNMPSREEFEGERVRFHGDQTKAISGEESGADPEIIELRSK